MKRSQIILLVLRMMIFGKYVSVNGNIYIYVEECNNTWRNSETKRSYYKYIKKEEERKHYAFLYSVRFFSVKKYHVMRYFEQTPIVQILWYSKMYLTKSC